MSNQIISAAQAKLESARATVIQLRGQLAQAERDERRWEMFIASYGELASSDPQIGDIGGSPLAPVVNYKEESVSRRGRTMHETERLVTELIGEFERPIKTGELLAELARRGFEVGGLSPQSTLSARLSRSQNIVNDRARGWMTKEMADGLKGYEASPPANHPTSGPVEPAAGGGT